MASGSQTEDQLVELNARETGDTQICVCVCTVLSLCEALPEFHTIPRVCLCVLTHMRPCGHIRASSCILFRTTTRIISVYLCTLLPALLQNVRICVYLPLRISVFVYLRVNV